MGLVCVLLALGSAIATDVASSKTSLGEKPTQLGYDHEHPEVQPSQENLDLAMHGRIREEGFNHSHIMEYASGLFDGIRPRLAGSPNLAKANAWTRDQFTAMGCSNAHVEIWGEFGLGWRQISTPVFMTSPGTAVFIAQATPFSPPTAGTVNADLIAVPALKEEKDFDSWRGKLAGKIILYSKSPLVNADPEKPPVQHYDASKLGKIYEYPNGGDMQEQHVITKTPKEIEAIFKKAEFQEQVARFFADEHALALLIPGYAGDAGVFEDDNGEEMGECFGFCQLNNRSPR